MHLCGDKLCTQTTVGQIENGLATFEYGDKPSAHKPRSTFHGSIGKDDVLCQNAFTPQAEMDELLHCHMGRDFYAISYASHASLKRTTTVILESRARNAFLQWDFLKHDHCLF